jgi:hypothetical protein
MMLSRWYAIRLVDLRFGLPHFESSERIQSSFQRAEPSPQLYDLIRTRPLLNVAGDGFVLPPDPPARGEM